MYPYHVFNLEPAGTFGMYPICYRWVSGGYIQPEPAMYSRCFRWFPGPLTPSEMSLLQHPIIKAATFGERSRPTISLTTGWLLGEITRFSNEEYTPSSGWGHYPTMLKVTSLFVSS